MSELPTCTSHHSSGPARFPETRCDGCGMRMWAYNARKGDAQAAKEREMEAAKTAGRKPDPNAWLSKMPGECHPHVHVKEGQFKGLPAGVLYVEKVAPMAR